jgi:hypothetical protein
MASKPAELTDLIALLVSPHATSVTGAKYVIDGTVPTAQPDLAIYPCGVGLSYELLPMS